MSISQLTSSSEEEARMPFLEFVSAMRRAIAETAEENTVVYIILIIGIRKSLHFQDSEMSIPCSVVSSTKVPTPHSLLSASSENSTLSKVGQCSRVANDMLGSIYGKIPSSDNLLSSHESQAIMSLLGSMGMEDVAPLLLSPSKEDLEVFVSPLVIIKFLFLQKRGILLESLGKMGVRIASLQASNGSEEDNEESDCASENESHHVSIPRKSSRKVSLIRPRMGRCGRLVLDELVGMNLLISNMFVTLNQRFSHNYTRQD